MKCKLDPIQSFHRPSPAFTKADQLLCIEDAQLTGKRAWNGLLNIGRCLFLDRADRAATTFLLSSGRSGSTWLGSALHSLPDTRMVFEPFHARSGVPSLSPYRYRYIPPESDDGLVAAGLISLLAGSSWNPWIEQFNPVGKLTYHRRLVKEVRINLLLPFLLKQFHDCRFILLMRHPAAVAQSQNRLGWNLEPERLLEQSGLDGVSWMPDMRKLRLSDDLFERNLAFWAIENRIAIDAAQKAAIPIVFYEEVCIDPASQLARLETYLGTKFPESALDGMAEVSWSTDKSISAYSVQEKVSAWQSRVRSSQINAMLRILESTGLDQVYGRDVLPNSTIAR